MHADLKQNLQEKIDLVSHDLLIELDQKIKAMTADHASKGLLRSGLTVRRVMDFISEGNVRLHYEVLSHFDELKPKYGRKLEADVVSLVAAAQENLESEASERLKDIVEKIGMPDLYERVLPDVEATMVAAYSKFNNALNTKILDLKFKSKKPPMAICLWLLEASLALTSLYVIYLWINDPSGDYQSILAGIAGLVALVGVGLKFSKER